MPAYLYKQIKNKQVLEVLQMFTAAELRKYNPETKHGCLIGSNFI